MKNLLILQPTGYNADGSLYRTQKRWVAGITLPYLAALVPNRSWDMTLIDERIQDIPDHNWDAVAFTFFTHSSRHTFELADRYREQNIPVLMGGWHVSFNPESSQTHADAIGIGEGERIFPLMLNDLENKALKPVYISDNSHQLNKLKFPRWDKMDLKKYRINFLPIFTTRGCPYGCTFCEVTALNGTRVRFKPIDEVVEEVKFIKSLGMNRLQFVDDNFAMNHRYTKMLLEKLIPLKIRWTCLWTVKDCKDEELLNLAKRSGVWHINMGMESINEDSLKSMHKYQNKVRDYESLLKRLNKKGIFYSLNFIFGWDPDTPRIFEDTYQFLVRNKVPMAFFSVLTPRRGTKIYEELKNENRIFDENLADVREGKCIFYPKHMVPHELEISIKELYRRFYSYPSILRRLLPLRTGYGEILFSNFLFHFTSRNGKDPLDYY